MIIVGIIALLLGGTLINGLLSGDKQRRSCIDTVEATCQRIVCRSLPNNYQEYRIFFAYEYKNKNYESVAKDTYSCVKDIHKLGIEEGKTTSIFLSPEKPDLIYARKKKVYVGDIVVWCIAIEFTVLGLYLVIDAVVKWLMKLF